MLLGEGRFQVAQLVGSVLERFGQAVELGPELLHRDLPGRDRRVRTTLSGSAIEHELLRLQPCHFGEPVAHCVEPHQPRLQLAQLGGHGVQALAQVGLHASILLCLDAGKDRAKIGAAVGHGVTKRKVVQQDHQRQHQDEQGQSHRSKLRRADIQRARPGQPAGN
jgi:hypothetical protein